MVWNPLRSAVCVKWIGGKSVTIVIRLLSEGHLKPPRIICAGRNISNTEVHAVSRHGRIDEAEISSVKQVN